MRLFFLDRGMTELADGASSISKGIRDVLLKQNDVKEVDGPESADAIIIQEERTTYKDFRYIDRLLRDQYIGGYLNKVFTINTDDSATGLLRGLYTSIPKNRYNPKLQRVVPYIEFPNPLVFQDKRAVEPNHLGVWCGNTKSNKIRGEMVQALQGKDEFYIKTSTSWFNHGEQELQNYVEAIKGSKFSLCPAGWAPVTIRIYESMALGRCPVIIANNFVPPIGPQWHEFALFYPEKKLAELPGFLRKQEPYYRQLGEKAKENWERYFGGSLLLHYYADSLLSLIRSTPPYTKEMEIRRWNSFSTYWQNRWSIPHRIINKVKIIMK